MKLKLDSTPIFSPITISLTFETQAEADVFGSLFNHCTTCDVIREVLKADLITYKDFEKAGIGKDIIDIERYVDVLDETFRRNLV